MQRSTRGGESCSALRPGTTHAESLSRLKGHAHDKWQTTNTFLCTSLMAYHHQHIHSGYPNPCAEVRTVPEFAWCSFGIGQIRLVVVLALLRTDLGVPAADEPASQLYSHTSRSAIIIKPIVAASLGCDAVFLMGGPTRDTAPTPLLLRSGDVVVLGGSARNCFHVGVLGGSARNCFHIVVLGGSARNCCHSGFARDCFHSACTCALFYQSGGARRLRPQWISQCMHMCPLLSKRLCKVAPSATDSTVHAHTPSIASVVVQGVPRVFTDRPLPFGPEVLDTLPHSLLSELAASVTLQFPAELLRKASLPQQGASVSQQGPTEVQRPMEVQSPIEMQGRFGVQSKIEVQSPTEAHSPIEVRSPMEVQSPVEVRGPTEVQSSIEAQSPIEVQSPMEVQRMGAASCVKPSHHAAGMLLLTEAHPGSRMEGGSAGEEGKGARTDVCKAKELLLPVLQHMQGCRINISVRAVR
ncbi:hypothetical protein DUNSADRAFT_3727 [Dunaliella salina]|uniref:Alpha-ketoglutarate-dependent dioxygenase AlkB-like domain-containing protein n=1 Tax=Dunaliella salina TaxID=3046 RepID=A0ABQ7GTF7_DUNSA|nr:hypothetical protein DUNSADRAFT_3727 [Dunaliella salina]|eukprot:KAF5837894.1 hypothetical protein DUNSADRAFT_3727 [Dunaliella salina]